jgi:hypothetical protein
MADGKYKVNNSSIPLEVLSFSDAKAGIIYNLLLDTYSKFGELVQQEKTIWKEFDRFIFDNLNFMNDCGFITVEDKNPIGFMSWDPRCIPMSIEIGHNCIINKCKGKGKGIEQLRIGINKILKMKPNKIIVKTGRNDFFLPAQKMYESAGFKMKSIHRTENELVPEIIEYEMII